MSKHYNNPNYNNYYPAYDYNYAAPYDIAYGYPVQPYIHNVPAQNNKEALIYTVIVLGISGALSLSFANNLISHNYSFNSSIEKTKDGIKWDFSGNPNNSPANNTYDPFGNNRPVF